MATTEGASEASGEPWQRVDISKTDLLRARRHQTRLSSGRGIMLLVRPDGEITAWDHACYHVGGSLFDCDIEELPAPACEHVMVCKWHARKIGLQSGKLWYTKLDFEAGTEQLTATAVKQRRHKVLITGDAVFVADSSLDGVAIPSDDFAFRPF